MSLYGSTCAHSAASSHTELVTPPAAEPVSVAEANLHLRIATGQTEEDDLVAGLITAARQVCETVTRRAFVTQTWDLFVDGFPGSAQLWYVLRNLQRGRPPVTGRENLIALPRPPLQSVVSITYADPSGASIVLDPSQYRVSTGTPGRITPAYGLCWPQARCETDALAVRFVAGYGDASAVPGAIKAAIKLLVGHFYENREAVNVGVGVTVAELPMAVRALLAAEDWGSYA